MNKWFDALCLSSVVTLLLQIFCIVSGIPTMSLVFAFVMVACLTLVARFASGLCRKFAASLHM